jgi:hypothetical protein
MNTRKRLAAILLVIATATAIACSTWNPKQAVSADPGLAGHHGGLFSQYQHQSDSHNYVPLTIRADVAFANGSHPSEVRVVVASHTATEETTYSRLYSNLTSTVFLETMQLPAAYQDRRMEVTFWWHNDMTLVPPSEDDLFEATAAPHAARRTRISVNGTINLGSMTLAIPPKVATVQVSSPEALSVRVNDNEDIAPEFGIRYSASHTSSTFDLHTWSRSPEWWLSAVTSGNTLAYSDALLRNSSNLIAVSASGAVSGSVAPSLNANGWIVAVVEPDESGVHIDLSPHFSLPAIVDGSLMGAPFAKVANDQYTIDGLTPGSYTIMLVAPRNDLQAHAVVNVSAGATATHNF